MARGVLTVQQITVAGIAPSFTAGNSVDGHEFANDGSCYLEVKNTGAGACTVTILTPAMIGGMNIADATVTVPITTGDRIIGPFPTNVFNTALGMVQVDLSTATGVTLAAFRLGG